MKDINYIKRFANKYGLIVQEYTDEDFIHSDATKAGAVKSLSLLTKQRCSVIDFNFDDSDNLLGYNTECINSFVEKKGPRLTTEERWY